jgi:hypothetical protein
MIPIVAGGGAAGALLLAFVLFFSLYRSAKKRVARKRAVVEVKKQLDDDPDLAPLAEVQVSTVEVDEATGEWVIHLNGGEAVRVGTDGYFRVQATAGTIHATGSMLASAHATTSHVGKTSSSAAILSSNPALKGKATSVMQASVVMPSLVHGDSTVDIVSPLALRGLGAAAHLTTLPNDEAKYTSSDDAVKASSFAKKESFPAVPMNATSAKRVISVSGSLAEVLSQCPAVRSTLGLAVANAPVPLLTSKTGAAPTRLKVSDLDAQPSRMSFSFANGFSFASKSSGSRTFRDDSRGKHARGPTVLMEDYNMDEQDSGGRGQISSVRLDVSNQAIPRAVRVQNSNSSLLSSTKSRKGFA